jgi:predicted PurR-regulated permease PerM
LDRVGAPRWVGTTLVIVVAYAVLFVVGGLIVFAAVQFGHLVATNSNAFGTAKDAFDSFLSTLGVAPGTADALVQSIDPSMLQRAALTITKSVFSSALAFFFVLAYLIFMAADGARHPELEREFSATRRPLLDALARWAHNVRAYFVVNSLFGLVVALLDGVVLWAVGVPGVPIWIVLAFVTNYVPNIGFVIGLVPPVVLALITGGWPQALIVIAAYCAINVTLQELIQPKFVASTVSLSLTLTFFSVLFWTVVLGAVGAILAIPMTLLARALLIETDPDARWSRWITGDRGSG